MARSVSRAAHGGGFFGLLIGLSLAGCSSGGTGLSSGSATSSGSTGGMPDSGSCFNVCQRDADCCPGFGCDTILHANQCCILSGSPVQCSLSSDCCPPPDGGLAYCDGNGQCGSAPNCSPPGNPCQHDQDCCQNRGTYFCNLVNERCTLGSPTSSTGGSSTSGGSTTGSAGTGTTSGSTTGGEGAAWAFTWNFGVNQSCEQAGVGWVAVQLDGTVAGTFPCRDPSGIEGVTLPAGSGSPVGYVVSALDATGNITLAQIAGTTPPASGVTAVPVDLAFEGHGPSNLHLNWTFAGQSCVQAGVSQVQVVLTDPFNTSLSVNQSFPCAGDGGVDGVELDGYGSGQFPLTVSANGTDGGAFQASANISANGLSDANLLVDLLPASAQASGSLQIDVTFAGGTCQQAGLDSVSIQLATLQGAAVGNPAVVSCTDGGSSAAIGGLDAPATDFLWVEGVASGGVQQLGVAQVVVSPGGVATYNVVAQPSQ